MAGIILQARCQQTALAFQYMDSAARVELLSLLSFACCLIGGVSATGAGNLAVALQGLICSRTGSEAQVVGLCAFSLFTTITDVSRGAAQICWLQPRALPPRFSPAAVPQVVALCTDVDGWGGLWLAINIVFKLGAAVNASRGSHFYGAVTGDFPAAESSHDGEWPGWRRVD